KKRQEILLNNIYGVDIDYQATEVTQLSLYLKLLEDVTMNDAYQFSLIKEKILPDLRQNIVCGNSLIGTDILEGDLFEKTEERKLNPMNFEDAFPHVMKRGGFDAIVGNPPYVQSRSERLSETEKNYYIHKYSTAEYQLNTFGLFLEKAHKVARQGSLLGMIIPNYWLSTRYDLKLRKFLAIENSIVEILNVYNVFAEATVDTVVLLSERPHKNKFPKTFRIKSVDRNLKNIAERLNNVQSETWSFQHAYVVNEGSDDINVSFAKTVELSGQDTIEKYFILKFGMKPYEEGKGTPKQTRQMMQKKVYDSTKKIDKSYMPLLRARNVNRYSVNWEGDWIKYGDNLAAPRTFELFVGDRILVQRIVSSDRLFGTFVKDTFVCNTDVITLKPKVEFDNFNVLFFVGVLLSSVVGSYLKSRNVNLDRAAFPKINTETLGYLPIPKINFSDPVDKSRHDHIVKLVEQMLGAKEKLSEAKLESEKDRLELLCTSLDRQIDEAVYELYGLTAEDIKVVEGEK
ncbi:Eco57I restriction-modification methylase domain-containing protein, partial [bacterium]|nr:Eco57I restriction-modification methylase domain-containing protein [bacterium]